MSEHTLFGFPIIESDDLKIKDGDILLGQDTAATWIKMLTNGAKYIRENEIQLKTIETDHLNSTTALGL